ncbi:hypothetical protein ASPFODRAFT_435059 [Aspergillus luchuensis CBS 106.47]|uniref:Uncharacterized protein n=1 Tax=Aspergillus luchuensis (strain CBS 106.47) TaxID=1137211 RepID=A0A1M3TVH1_ASPLC|nr:hypothetical protein ASPFODRAFT_435059 [Aspergillus luchuensis CBS 106.47]
MSLSLQSTKKMVSGYEIPVLGYGVSILHPSCLVYLRVMVSTNVCIILYRSIKRASILTPTIKTQATSLINSLNSPPDVTESVTLKALELGYRHVRTPPPTPLKPPNPTNHTKLWRTIDRQRPTLQQRSRMRPRHLPLQHPALSNLLHDQDPHHAHVLRESQRSDRV